MRAIALLISLPELRLPPRRADFVAFAFDSSVIKEVELFQGGPMTVDDFTFARDNALPFGGSSSVPEPGSAYLLLAAAALGLPAVRKAIRK